MPMHMIPKIITAPQRVVATPLRRWVSTHLSDSMIHYGIRWFKNAPRATSPVCTSWLLSGGHVTMKCMSIRFPLYAKHFKNICNILIISSSYVIQFISCVKDSTYIIIYSPWKLSIINHVRKYGAITHNNLSYIDIPKNE